MSPLANSQKSRVPDPDRLCDCRQRSVRKSKQACFWKVRVVERSEFTTQFTQLSTKGSTVQLYLYTFSSLEK